MTSHDDLLARLRLRSPSLVDAALAHGLPTLGAALSLDEDDCALVMRRAERIAMAIAGMTEWTVHGDEADDTKPYGSTGTAPDGTTIQISRPNLRSKADPGAGTRIEAILLAPGTRGRIRVVAHIPEGSPQPRPDGSHGVAMCLAAHRTACSAISDDHEGLKESLIPNARHLAVLLSHTLRPDLEPGRVAGPATPPKTVIVRASDGARRLGVRIAWNPTSNNEVRLDESSYERLETVFPTALGLAVDHGLHAMHSNIEDEPNTRIILSRVSTVAQVPTEPADGVAVMRALSALGLDAMPTLVRRTKQ